MMSALSHLECSKCKRTYDADVVQQLCTCGAPLLARYDLAKAASTFTRRNLESREPSLWRYTELLPLRDQTHRVDLHERITPIIPLSAFGASVGLSALYLKDDGALPTGSF